MWSTAHREDRKTHAYLDPDVLPLCNPGLFEAFLWDYDLPEETVPQLVKRIERTDADGLVCRSCLRCLKTRACS